MTEAGIRILGPADVAATLPMAECIDAVEAAFVAHAEGRAIPPGVLGAHVEGGGFHLKAAGLLGARSYYAAKLNGNFHANLERFGLPRIQGLVLLADARNGRPLAVMDSTELTAIRTAAATAVAARRLSRADARSATICGCGRQGRAQLEALRCVRELQRVFLHDLDVETAASLAAERSGELEVVVLAPDELRRGTRASDVIVTSTPSRQPFLFAADVAPGAFVAAVGADSEEKQELAPELLARARVVVDHLEQCSTIGDLHHALEAGVLARGDVHGELHEILAGRVPGRTSEDEVFVFDSTGVALEDVAAAALAFERAGEVGAGEVVRW